LPSFDLDLRDRFDPAVATRACNVAALHFGEPPRIDVSLWATLTAETISTETDRALKPVIRTSSLRDLFLAMVFHSRYASGLAEF
jgi:hypothetical protein